MDTRAELKKGNCLRLMRRMESASVDSIVTDPPYGMDFIDQSWDKEIPPMRYWKEALRVAKPGAHMLAACNPCLYHRLATEIENAGWEIRTFIIWAYGTGTPKGVNIGVGIDEKLGNERKVTGYKGRESYFFDRLKNSGKAHKVTEYDDDSYAITEPVSEEGKKWEGWYTQLKPCIEAWVLARKPLDGTAVENVMKYGTGALNVQACRVFGIDGEERFPSNITHDGVLRDSDLAVGEASRFFYCAKASLHDRNEGLNGRNNTHPTVKPTRLMKYLCRLITPPGGVILDPFMGSGSTGKGALLEGFRFIGFEKEPENFEIAKKRIQHSQRKAEQ